MMEVDSNHDGCIDYNEFIVMMRKNTEYSKTMFQKWVWRKAKDPIVSTYIFSNTTIDNEDYMFFS
jgi:EF hand